MAQIASGNLEIYIRQLLSEGLGNDVDSQKQALAEKLIQDDNLRADKRINRYRISNQEEK